MSYFFRLRDLVADAAAATDAPLGASPPSSASGAGGAATLLAAAATDAPLAASPLSSGGGLGVLGAACKAGGAATLLAAAGVGAAPLAEAAGVGFRFTAGAIPPMFPKGLPAILCDRPFTDVPCKSVQSASP